MPLDKVDPYFFVKEIEYMYKPNWSITLNMQVKFKKKEVTYNAIIHYW
jgi:hypothetical protein